MAEKGLIIIEKNQLKPCPFCGSENVELTPKLNAYLQNTGYTYVMCNNCLFEGASYVSKEIAAFRWNRRDSVSVVLTSLQDITLRMFLMMTTNYRKKGKEASERLSLERNGNGTLKYPNMASNALWWEETDKTINEIIALLERAKGLN